MRLPNHIGVIPDGNRRWAEAKGLPKEKGYEMGLDPGLALFRLCRQVGIKELTYYGFTTDNNKRPVGQRRAFTAACIQAVEMLSKEHASLLVVGNAHSPAFPKELLPFTTRKTFGKGGIKVNFLVNYGWEWDLNHLKGADQNAECGMRNAEYSEIRNPKSAIQNHLGSRGVSRVDLVIRWGGRRRLSGFPPVQCVYADFYVLDEYWPDFKPEHFFRALRWYQEQDVTLGG